MQHFAHCRSGVFYYFSLDKMLHLCLLFLSLQHSCPNFFSYPSQTWMDRVAMRINCLGQENNLVTSTRTLTQLLNPESSAAFILKRSCRLSTEKEMFLFTLTGVQVMFFFLFTVMKNNKMWTHKCCLNLPKNQKQGLCDGHFISC